MTNEDKYQKYKIKNIFKWGMIISSFLVIVLEAFALFRVISLYWGFLPFLISFVFKYFYEKDDINKNKKDKKSKNSK